MLGVDRGAFWQGFTTLGAVGIPKKCLGTSVSQGCMRVLALGAVGIYSLYKRVGV